MTDKKKIRNIIELFIAWNGETEPIDVANIDSAVEFIDSSLQEKPVSEEWIEELRTKLDSMSKEEFEQVWGKYETEEKEEPVNEDLEKAFDKYSEDVESNYSNDMFDRGDIMRACMFGAQRQKEQMMAKAINAVVSQVPCSNEIILYNPSSVDKYYLPQEMNKLGLNKGDKIKLVIIKED